MFEPKQRYTAVIADIDRANADDPRTIDIEGRARPYEVIYSERMTQRLATMYPEASELLRIAARGQHIRRFDIHARNLQKAAMAITNGAAPVATTMRSCCATS